MGGREGTMLLGAVVATVALALAFLAQRYWLAQAWKAVRKIRALALRIALRVAIVAGVALAGAIALGEITVNLRGAVSPGTRWSAFFGLWLSSSVVAYLFVRLISALEWIWRRLVSVLRPAPPALAKQSASSPEEPADPARRYFFQTAGFFAGAVPFVSAVYGFASERLRFQVRPVDVPIANLAAGLEGLRIVQLSDIHIGSYMPVAQVRRAVGLANELDADLVVITGDFVTGRTDPLEDCIAELSRLRAPLGVWGCNGNHEIYAGLESEAAALFERFGMHMLRQKTAVLPWRGSALNLIGVDYQRQRAVEGGLSPMLAGLEALVRRDIPNILLSHNPNAFPRAAELGIELMLAGHTHGGQVRVEILDHRWSPARFLTPYVAGMYRRPMHDPLQVSDAQAFSTSASSPVSFAYVNRGIGTIGAPVRLGVPPEITLLTLRRA